ncbi:hypothetical protein [Spirillospora sp. NPDC047279]
MRDGETVLVLATTVKAPPPLTHIAVTDRRSVAPATEITPDGAGQGDS